MQRNLRGDNQEWVVLQKKIFTRWVQQKVLRKHIQVSDVTKDIGTLFIWPWKSFQFQFILEFWLWLFVKQIFKTGDGTLLIALMEVLSEASYRGKPLKAASSRVQKIDNVCSENHI